MDKQFTVKIRISEREGEICINGFRPKSSMGKAYMMVLHRAVESIEDDARMLERRMHRTANMAVDLTNLINKMSD